MIKSRLIKSIWRAGVLALSFVLFSLATVSAQDSEEVESYVVNLKSDTIYGKVVIHIRKGQMQSVSVKTEEDKLNFKVYQVLAVATDDGSIYHTKKILEKYQFAKLVYPGYASYYLYSSEEVAADKFTQQVLIKPDGQHVTFSSLAFRKRVAEFLGDCEAVQLKIEEGEYKRKDLEAILDEYNSCIISQTEMRAQAIAKAPTLSTSEQAKIDAFAGFVQKVAKMDEFNGNKELMDMLNDVQSKLTDKESIPGYLKGAIKEQFGDQTDLVEEFDRLIAG